jgi:glutamate/tyrosine decarboxylase-like PLP-dependent enzyme
MFYTPEMSRRARIIEFWSTMKYLGKSGINDMVQGMHERAIQFKEELSENGFEILNDVVFNQVVVYCGSDKLTVEAMKNVQEARVCWAGGSKWQGKAVIRISVSSWATTAEDVTRSVRSFVEARDKAKNK